MADPHDAGAVQPGAARGGGTTSVVGCPARQLSDVEGGVVSLGGNEGDGGGQGDTTEEELEGDDNPAPVAGRPRPLALNPSDPSLQLRPLCLIAVGMGLHARLGVASGLSQLPPDILGRIVRHLESGMPFHEYIYRDLHGKCPGLIPGFATLRGAACQDARPCVDRIFSFIGFLHQSVCMVRDKGLLKSCRNADPLLDWDQLQSVLPGQKEVTEEVADILLKWMARLLGVDVMHRGAIIPHSQGFAGLAVPKKCLVWDTLAIDALVNACHGHQRGERFPRYHGEWDPDRYRAYEGLVNEFMRANADAFATYARDLHVLLRPYDTTLWSICSRSVIESKVVRPTTFDYYFKVLSVANRGKGEGGVLGQVWDPTRAPFYSDLDSTARCAMPALFKEQSDDSELFSVESQPSHQRIGGHGTGSLFHSMLNIAMVCTGMSLPADNEECAIYAAALQGHCYLSMLRDWVHSGLDLDIDATFREWLADNPELTPLPAFAGGGGSPAADAAASAATNAAAVAAASADGVADGNAVGFNEDARCVDLSNYRITVTHAVYRQAIEQLQKLVEFQSGNTTEVFFEGMQLLFSGNAKERRKGNTYLVCAEVAKVCRLSCAEACARFPREAAACNLKQMCSEWGCCTVICYVLKPDTIRIATELVNLAAGNLGILKQIIGTTGAPRFCHVSDLGKCVQVQLRTGVTALCSFCKVWPPDSPRARSDGGGNNEVVAGAPSQNSQAQVLCSSMRPHAFHCVTTKTGLWFTFVWHVQPKHLMVPLMHSGRHNCVCCRSRHLQQMALRPRRSIRPRFGKKSTTMLGQHSMIPILHRAVHPGQAT